MDPLGQVAALAWHIYEAAPVTPKPTTRRTLTGLLVTLEGSWRGKTPEH
jgi:hypothetical protein